MLLEKLNVRGQVADSTFQNGRHPYTPQRDNPEVIPASLLLVQKLRQTHAKLLQQTKIELWILNNQLSSLVLLLSAATLAAKWRVISYIFICKIKFGEERDNFIK